MHGDVHGHFFPVKGSGDDSRAVGNAGHHAIVRNGGNRGVGRLPRIGQRRHFHLVPGHLGLQLHCPWVDVVNEHVGESRLADAVGVDGHGHRGGEAVEGGGEGMGALAGSQQRALPGDDGAQLGRRREREALNVGIDELPVFVVSVHHGPEEAVARHCHGVAGKAQRCQGIILGGIQDEEEAVADGAFRAVAQVVDHTVGVRPHCGGAAAVEVQRIVAAEVAHQVGALVVAYARGVYRTGVNSAQHHEVAVAGVAAQGA